MALILRLKLMHVPRALAADLFVEVGVTIGEEAVVGVGSLVFKDMPAGIACFGYPCVAVKKRVMADQRI